MREYVLTMVQEVAEETGYMLMSKTEFSVCVLAALFVGIGAGVLIGRFNS